jgi:lipopolysaccharide export system protein LptA
MSRPAAPPPRTAPAPAILVTALLAAALLVAVPAPAADQDQPIDIAADGVEIDDGRQLSVYTGNVEVRQGSMQLWADQVTVHHQASRQPQRITALGAPARYRQLTDDGKEVKARSRRMEYDADSAEVVLIGDAQLTQGRDRFQSDRILYDRTRAVVKAGASAQGRQRVRISIDPAGH